LGDHPVFGAGGPGTFAFDESTMNSNSEPLGIGGWLILPLLGLILTPIRLGLLLATTHAPIFTGGAWEVLTTPGNEAYHPLWAPLMMFEIVGNVCFLVFSLVLLVLFFGKHYRLPILMVVFYLSNLVFVGGDLLFANLIPAIAEMSDPESFKELTRTIVGAAIWVPYFLKSERVQNTFLNGRDEYDAMAYQAAGDASESGDAWQRPY
jgi:uncharacterized protein DUF2569